MTNNTTGGGNVGQDNATSTNTSPGASVNCTVKGEVVVGGVVTQPAVNTCN